MEQLTLLLAELNTCTKETKIMSGKYQTVSERQKAINDKRADQQKAKKLVDEFVATLPAHQQESKSRWTLVADYMNSHPEGSLLRERWSPQGIARVCQLADLWNNRNASPELVTPERRKIFRMISQLREAGKSWYEVADALNRSGLYWVPKGRPTRPFDHKSANDYYRHHQHLWPIRVKRGSRAQQELLVLTESVGEQSDRPKVKTRKSSVPRSIPQLPPPPPPPPGTVEKPRRSSAVKQGKGNVSVFKRHFGDDSVKVVVQHRGGRVDLVVRYSGTVGSNLTNQLMSHVTQIQSIDYEAE